MDSVATKSKSFFYIGSFFFKKVIIYGTLLLLNLAACTTPVKKIKTEGILLIPYAVSSLDGSATDLSCRFLLKSEEQNQEPQFSLKKTLANLQVTIPATEYKLIRVDCDGLPLWEAQEGQSFKINVYETLIAVMEPLQIIVSKKELKIDGFYRVNNQHDMIRSSLRAFRPLHDKKLVSAYNKKPITDAIYLLDNAKYDRGGLIQANRMPIPASDLGDFGFPYDKCGREESLVNRLRIGTLELVGRYENGVLKKLTITKSENLYSENYEKCIASTLEGYKPQINKQAKEKYKITNSFDLTFRY